MTILEAIQERKSRRLYLTNPIEKSVVSSLQDLITTYNSVSGLSIRFIEDGSAAFSRFRKTYGLFSGVRSLLVMAGSKTDLDVKEKVGYFGERLVLEATKLGLGTCWVGGTFESQNPVFQLLDDETLVCVIAIGYVESLSFKEKMIHQMVAGKSKTIAHLLESKEDVPEFILEAIKAVQKAPSAANKQPIRFNYQKGVLSISTDNEGSFNLIDLGIAKAHFEVVAGGRFELGTPAEYIP